jgi:hypothetical protein
VRLAIEPASGALGYALKGHWLALLKTDPPTVSWYNPALGRFMGLLFDYKEFLEAVMATKGAAREIVLTQLKPAPDPESAQAAGVSMTKTGNGLTGHTTHLSHPDLGEFARLKLMEVSFSTPQVFVALGFLVELDRQFTPVPRTHGPDPLMLSPYMVSLYNARHAQMNRDGATEGFTFSKVGVYKAGASAGDWLEVRCDVTLTADLVDQPDAYWSACRLVLRTFGFDRNVGRLVLDYSDGATHELSERDGRMVVDTAELSSDLVLDEAGLDAYARAHSHRPG